MSQADSKGDQHSRYDVLGSKVSCLDSDSALEILQRRIESRAGGYVCFTNVHAVVTGTHDKVLQDVTNSSFMSLADGKPVYWVARSCGGVGHVPGPDFMLTVLKHLRHERHYFYGSTREVLQQLESNLFKVIPDLKIAGSLSPPFRTLSSEELQEDYERIRESGATLVWIGLGAPKQEKWMGEAWQNLRPAILLGVGAAFDFHANVVSRAPESMRKAGLEWLYRLMMQPRRLWKRYLVTNTKFIAGIAKQRVIRLLQKVS